MYIASLKLWNFRKYGMSEDITEDTNPNLNVSFNRGLNVLIGENDSGKSAILDAIKLVLKTHAYEWIKVDNDDFHIGTNKLRIEIIFRGFEVSEARHFTEWIGWDKYEDGQTDKPLLRLIYQVERNNQRIFPAEVCAGMDFSGMPLNAFAREYLKTTYLKALRDADSELTAKHNSRVAQIFQKHELLVKKDGEQHPFEKIIEDSNTAIGGWFNAPENKAKIKDIINEFVKAFIAEDGEAEFYLSAPEILSILEKIAIGLKGQLNPGLGTLNRLYMAVELLHLRKENWDGARVCLIEELEAHLHPQAQLKIIEKLRRENNVQFILTTHSPNIASKVPLRSLIICKGNNVFSMGAKYTKLDIKDYKYLERFLDVTKSNLFFANGVILVEGWSEEVLAPAIAKKMGYDLTKKEISIVNVGSTAYLHFAKIFLRADGNKMGVPVAIVTDLDNRPDQNGNFGNEPKRVKTKKDNLDTLREDLKESDVQLFLAKEWTLEWCLYKSATLSELFKTSVSEVHSKTDEFKLDDKGAFKVAFEEKFRAKLRKDDATAQLDKVSIASVLADKIESSDIAFTENDEYLDYIIKAIKHVCE